MFKEEMWEKAIEMKNNNEPTDSIYEFYKNETGGKATRESFVRMLRLKRNSKKNECSESKSDNKGSIVGVIGDFHAPFNKKGYLEFCKKTFDKYGVNEVVMIGDLVDNHAVSRHQTETDALGGWSEYSMAKVEIEKMKVMFPKLKLALGNHDRIPERQASTLGLHEGFIKSFEEMWGLPDEWEVDISFEIDGVKYSHGLGSGGANGTLNTALKMQTSLVIGHKHSCSGVRYMTTEKGTIFGMDVGCGVDVEKYAFRYGKYMPCKPVLSCGIIINGKETHVVPMLEGIH